MSTRLKGLIGIGAAAMLIAACSSGGTAAPSASTAAPSATTAAPSANPSVAAKKIKVTLLTKATGGFWDAMIAGAKKYETDHPNDIELTTNACKTNDDTPCQIAEIQDAVTKGAQAIVISPMGVGVTDALNTAQQAGVRIVFVDNTIPGVIPDAVAATNNVKGGEAAGAYIKTQLKSGDTIGLLEAVRGVPNLDQRIDGVKKALEGTGVNVVIGAQQTLCDTKTGAAVTQDLLTKYPNLTADLLGVRLPGDRCRGGRGVQAAPAADLRLRRRPGDVQAHLGRQDHGHDGPVAVQDDQPRRRGGGQVAHGRELRQGHRHGRHARDEGQRG